MMWSFLPKRDTSRPEDPEEVELAYMLQNIQDRDPAVMKRLIGHYSSSLYLWVETLIYYQHKIYPSREQILEILEALFKNADEHLNEFHGHQSIADWLFAIGLQVSERWKGKSTWPDADQTNQEGGRIKEKNQDLTPEEGISLEKLKKDGRNALVLRYLFDLSLADIAQINDRSVKVVHQWLVHERNKLTSYSLHPHLGRELQAYIDGLLDDDPGELERVNQHLAGCEVCQESFQDLENVEKTVATQLKAQWKQPLLTTEELNKLLKSAMSETEQLEPRWKQLLSIRQIAWLAGLAVMVAAATLISIKLIPIDNRLSQPLPTVPPELPPIVQQMSPKVRPQTVNTPEAPIYIAPAFSNDGKWAVFTASAYTDNSHAVLNRTVYLYNQESSTMQPINYSSDVGITWVWWDLTPSISGDGHWVVYVSSSNDASIEGEPCITRLGRSCLDILLYDRVTGDTRRISQGFDGGAANGDSLAPTISVDGHWIAFWSTANNLVGDSNPACQNNDFPITCLNIYLYNIETGKIASIPIQSTPGDSVYGVDRISLSADGRYIGFTMTSNAPEISLEGNTQVTRLDGNLPINVNGNGIPLIINSTEAIVYDRLTGSYELENQSQDGSPGNGESSSPILSADGRYVAFVSASSNLVPSQTDKNSEVYVRDRNTGQVEIISTTSDGQPAVNDSGLTFMERGYYSLDISPDGRYVVFESTAANLAPMVNPECDVKSGRECILLYVRDRQSNTTEVISALPSQDFTLFPGISADGRWIHFMEYFHDCSASQLHCSDIMLYDRQTGWISNLTKFGEQAPRLSWTSTGSLALPWQSWESTSLALSPDRSLIALGGNDGTVRLWNQSQMNETGNRATPAYLFRLDGNDYFSSLTFNNDGEWLAAGTSSGAMYVWDINNNKLIYQNSGLNNLIHNLVFTPDNSQLVVSTAHEVWMWSLKDSQLAEVNSFSYGTPDSYAIAISPMANMIASARTDGTIWLQKLPSGELIDRLEAGQVVVKNLVFSGDGLYLASREADGTISIWHITCNTCQISSVTPYSRFQAYSSNGDLIFSPDHEFLAATGIVGEVPVWSTTDGTLHYMSSSLPNEMVYSLGFTNDGSRLAVAFETQIATWSVPLKGSPELIVKASDNQFVDSSPFPSGSLNDYSSSQSMLADIKGIYYDITQTASSAKFPLLVPARLPNNYTFVSGMIYGDGSVRLRYIAIDNRGNQATLYISETQVTGQTAPTMIVGAGAEVIQTQIVTAKGLVPAEFVQGDWQWRESFTRPPDGSASGVAHSVYFWDAEAKSIHLRWIQDGILIGLYFQPVALSSLFIGNSQGSIGSLDRSLLLSENDLEQIAGGMEPAQSDPSITDYIPIMR